MRPDHAYTAKIVWSDGQNELAKEWSFRTAKAEWEYTNFDQNDYFSIVVIAKPATDESISNPPTYGKLDGIKVMATNNDTYTFIICILV